MFLGEYNVFFDLFNECYKNINISIVVYFWINVRCYVNIMVYFGVYEILLYEVIIKGWVDVLLMFRCF